MKSLIKAQLYQISRTRVYYLVFLTLMLLAMMFGAVEWLNGENSLEEWQKLTASDFATRMENIVSIAMMGMSFFVSFFCADDFTDKTVNYEIMSGRIRKQAYLARVVVSIVLSILFGLLMMFGSLGISVLLTGWGDSVPFGAVAARILLLTFPFIRISCFCVMVAYFIKRPGFAFLSFYGVVSVVSILKPATDDSGVLTVFNSINTLLKYKEWHIFGLESPVEMVYTPMPETAFIIRCIFVSIAVGAVYLIIGYNYFHFDDLE